MTDDYEQTQAQRAEHLSAYEQYAAEEARGYEQIFWEQVFMAAFTRTLSDLAPGVTFAAGIESAAAVADRACAERAKRLK